MKGKKYIFKLKKLNKKEKETRSSNLLLFFFYNAVLLNTWFR